MREKKDQLLKLYEEFEETAKGYLESAVCAPGCADCCTNVGNVDAATLEGLLILSYLQNLPSSRRDYFARKLKENRKTKERSAYARCAFLLENNTCGIYEVRPFSCRRLYSIKVCGNTGPTVHRGNWLATEETLYAIQQLDCNGYSGHISYILQLLKDAKFRKIYLNGGFSPEDIRDYAQKRAIVINRYVERPSH